MFISVADPEPFNFGVPDPDTDSKKSVKIMEEKKSTKITRILYFIKNTILFNAHK